MHLITERIDPVAFVRGPILAAAISLKFLNVVLRHPRATDILYLPWTQEELNEFKRYHPKAISV